jgi:predicted transglutaminase-like cysteine proteinase
MSNTITITLGGVLIAAVAFTSPAAAAPAATVTPVDFSNAAFAPVTGVTTIPVGAADFCRRQPGDCRPEGRVVQAEALTDASWQQLIAVNDDVNAKVVPQTDQDNYHVAEYWTYPTDGRGDCEDIALQKRRELISAGWDPSALLMTVVREQNGDGHAVLMVRTDRGDLILDNQDNRILRWNETSYDFIKRQSQADAGKWVALNDNRTIVLATANN